MDPSFQLYMFSQNYYGYQHPAMLSEVTKAVIEEDLDQLTKLVDLFGFGLHPIDHFGNGPLHIAIIKNNAPILDYLLSKDTKYINRENLLGETPLLRAIIEEKYKLAEKLVFAGADVTIPNYSNVTPLHLAVNNPHLAHLLIKRGADVNKRSVFNQTPLHCAVDCNSLEGIYMLLYYNADANVANDMYYTPFMMAMENKNVNIQEALFEYVDDYDATTKISKLSVLGLALIHNSPFTEEMIMRGADLNNVDSYENGAFDLAMEYCRIRGRVKFNIIKLIWEKMDYIPIDESSILGRLDLLEKPVFHGIVDIFIQSDKFDVIAESVRKADDFAFFITQCRKFDLPLEKLSLLCFGLLSYGYRPKEIYLAIIYSHWGYCEIFEVLMHMHIREVSSTILLEYIPTKLIYDIRYTTKTLLDALISIIEQDSHPFDHVVTLVVFTVLDHFVYPPLVKAYLKLRRTDCATLKIMALPKVPSLLALSRDKARQHIQNSYNVQTSRELYTLINNLDIADAYKKILTLETVTSRPVFKITEFKRYIKMLRMTQVRKQGMVPIIQNSIKNSVVI